ncbi:MAG: cupin domain-containing protein [Pseudomonadota bacterium]
MHIHQLFTKAAPALAPLLALALLGAPSGAHEPGAGHAHATLHKAQTVVPEAEQARAQALLATGPTETSGIRSVALLDTVSLDGEFDSSDGLMMRVRELVIEPGGIVAVHQHTNRPGAAYIIEGEMTEHRSSEEGALVKSAGDTAMERSGVIHWWENTGDTAARALVVDIVKAE